MATYNVTRYRYVRNPTTGQLSRQPYRETIESKTASLLGEVKNIQTAAESGKAYTELSSPLAGGQERIYTSTQLESLQNIDAAKRAGSDPRTFRTIDPQFKMTKEQQALMGAIDMGRGVIDLGEAGALAEREVRVQPSLEKIRRRKKAEVERAVIGMTRKRGKASLLSSQAGGAGFFQRYFR
jgi:hypothetical protein